jgi:hypothetical protein
VRRVGDGDVGVRSSGTSDVEFIPGGFTPPDVGLFICLAHEIWIQKQRCTSLHTLCGVPTCQLYERGG